MTLLGRMALVALVIGTSLNAAATERIDLRLVLTGTLAWSFVPVLQLLTGLLLIRGTGAERLVALDRYFATGWPWALWIIAAHAAFIALPALRVQALWLLPTVLVPIVWTIRLLAAFARETLDLPAAAARRRVLLHQMATLALLLGYAEFAGALWPRVIGFMR